ncbi:putative bifunctional diguanylate cyclase/phosphodiesterase [Sulfurimonas sp.]|uniref:putative bifunctional diguanylate cyclase/phosphodiesterase n=1 Tax=Sulfurimonas sp. TaxID=2022749 RepID=UPI003D120FCF
MKNLEEVFHAKLVKIAYEHLKVSSIAIAVNAVLLAYILYPYVDNTILVIWLVLTVSVTMYRFFLAKRYHKDPTKMTAQQWEYKFLIALFFSSVLWTTIPIFFFVEGNYMVQAAVLIVYAGLAAGAVSSLASLKKAFRMFLLVLMVPIIIILFLQNTQVHFAMGLLVSLYLALVLVVGERFYGNYRSILESKMMYEEEKEKFSVSRERFEILFKSAPVGFFFYDQDFIIREVNQKFVEFLEAPKEFLIGLNLKQIPDQRIFPALQSAMDNINGMYEGEYKSQYKKKQMYVDLQTSPLRDTSGKVIGAIGIVNDITEKMHALKQIEHQAMYDTLTNIPNRLTLIERVERELIRFKRHNVIFAVLFLDLDHFKNINDSLGHAVGDSLLNEVASRLQSIVRSEDTVARIGGDEFVILLPDLSYDEKMAANKAERIALKIYTVFEEPFSILDHQLSISTSIGIALASNEDENADDILKHADIAMYQAKKEGRATSRFYQQQMDIWIKRRLELENGLRNSFYNNELQVYYQPIVEVQSGNIIGAEALLRWNSKEFGSVSPVEFIPVAEESGLIIQIGDFVMRKAFSQFVKWKQECKDTLKLEKIAINISVRQFSRVDFIANVKNAISMSKIEANNIEMEIVESIIIDDLVKAKEKMQELRSLGLHLSIDDFGTGYSSLSYLKQLPFTTLKIDRSFVQDIDVDEEDKELIETILNIAKRFNLQVVAEGVETLEQLRFLQEKECNLYQGFYCSPAVSAEEFMQLLEKQNPNC